MNKKICVIGGGRWGQNHVRTLSQLGCLTAIVESSPDRLRELLGLYPGVVGYTDYMEAVEAGYDGYTIATPAETHYQVAKEIISRGLNVLIEKPMTLTAEQSWDLVEMARKSGSRVMVGHVLLFHPAIKKIKEVVGSGKLGKLHYVYSTRLNLGTVRTEESVFASFAPHDISVLDYIIGSSPIKIEAKGEKFLQEKIYDTTMTQMEYADNIHAHIFVSWLHPFKEQRLVLIGSQGMISFDDSSKEKEIFFHHKRIDFNDGIPVKVEEPDEVIVYERAMPLEEELRYFVEHLDSKIEVNTAEDGYNVVRVLENVQSIIKYGK